MTLPSETRPPECDEREARHQVAMATGQNHTKRSERMSTSPREEKLPWRERGSEKETEREKEEERERY